jgi:hypothetical protein
VHSVSAWIQVEILRRSKCALPRMTSLLILQETKTAVAVVEEAYFVHVANSRSHSRGGAGGDVAVGCTQDQNEAVAHGNAGTGQIEFEFPFKTFG